jgi:hypothetical protein
MSPKEQIFGQQFINPEFHNSVRLASANLHDRPGTRGQACDGAGETLGAILIAVFIDIFHDG